MNVSHGCLAPTGQQPPYRGLMSYVHCSVSDSHPSTGANLSLFSLDASPFPFLSFICSILYHFRAPFPIAKRLPQNRIHLWGPERASVSSSSTVREEPRTKTFFCLFRLKRGYSSFEFTLQQWLKLLMGQFFSTH